MIYKAAKIETKFQHLIEAYIASNETLKDSKIIAIDSPISSLECYYIQASKQPFVPGFICAINQDISIWSSDANALKSLFAYQKAGEPNQALSLDAAIALFKMFKMPPKTLIITEANKKHYTTLERRITKPFTSPKKRLKNNTIIYSFWLYKLIGKRLDYFELCVDSNSVLTMTMNGTSIDDLSKKESILRKVRFQKISL